MGIGFGCHSQASQTSDAATDNIPNKGNFAQVCAVKDGEASFIYLKTPGSASRHRLTTRTRGWETEPVLSPNGKMVAFSVADNLEAKSEVWVSQIDGSNAHRVSAQDEDALLPAFADNATLLYVISRFSGHYSPIARPRKHDFDIEKIAVDPSGSVAGAKPVELTHQHFFDLRSLSVSPDGQHFLVSTSGYPIGDLIEGFEIANPLEIKFIYQPHVPTEPSTGAAFGDAAYIHDGTDIVFTAATEPPGGGNFDYNVYQMSAVTGSEITLLSKHSGMIDSLSVGPRDTISVSANGMNYTLDPQTHVLNPD